MKIAFISQYFYPEQFSNNAIAKGMVARGHEVDVICCVPNYPEGRFFSGYSNKLRRSEVWCDIRIHRARTFARGKRSFRLLVNYLAYVFFGILQARKLARVNRPDISFVSMPSPLTQALVGLYLKKRFAVPLVYWVQDIWPESATYSLGLKNPLIVKPITRLSGWLYRQADLVLVQSAAFQPMIERFGVSPNKIVTFPNTAPATFRPVSREESPDEAALVPQDGFRVMFAGNIGESQDFDTLIDTAKLLKDQKVDVKWIIVGSGRDMERVKRRVADENVSQVFYFLGRFPEERMPKFFSQADALIVSLRNSDIFSLTVPYKIQCYMACEKPILASLDGEGARVVTEASAGLSVPTQRPDLLCAAVCNLAGLSNEELNTYGKNGLACFHQNYQADVLYDRLEKILHQILEGKVVDLQ